MLPGSSFLESIPVSPGRYCIAWDMDVDCTGAQIPPVSPRELPLAGPYHYRVCEGFPRFYASIAANFKYLPGIVS